MSPETNHQTVPSSAFWLGWLGVIPFALCSLVSVFSNGALNASGVTALLTYGAIILSFLGGIHWGLAIHTDQSGKPNMLQRLVISVIPALLAWVSLMLAPAPGCVLLSCAFIAMLFVDVYASRAGLAPAWYARLRVPLSSAAAASLLVAAFFENLANP